MSHSTMTLESGDALHTDDGQRHGGCNTVVPKYRVVPPGREQTLLGTLPERSDRSSPGSSFPGPVENVRQLSALAG